MSDRSRSDTERMTWRPVHYWVAILLSIIAMATSLYFWNPYLLAAGIVAFSVVAVEYIVDRTVNADAR